MSHLVHRIFSLMKRDGMSVNELSERSLVSLTNLERILTAYSHPTPAVLSKIAQALSVSVDYLLGLTDSPLVTDMRDVPVIKKTRTGRDFGLEDVVRYIPMKIDRTDATEYFFITSRDNEMIDLNIYKKDFVLITPQSIVEDGQVALVSVNRRLAVLRRLYHDGPVITLVPANIADRSCEEQVYDCRKTKIKVVGQASVVVRDPDAK